MTYRSHLCNEMLDKLQEILDHIEELKSIPRLHNADIPNPNLIDHFVHLVDVNTTTLRAAINIENYATLQDGITQLKPTPFNPQKMLADLTSIFKPGLNYDQHLITKLSRHDNILVETDEARLRLILNNLLCNAIKYTPRGTISLSFDYYLDSQSDLHTMTFVVEDEGVGITPEAREELSTWFLQDGNEYSSSSSSSAKTGFGLKVCKMIVKLLGGTINVESTKQTGTKFTFTIKCKILKLSENIRYHSIEERAQITDIIRVNKVERPIAGYFADLTSFLANNGEIGHLILNTDWSKTDIGPIKAWPQSLISSLSICLKNPFPKSIWWGPNFTLLYNDGYKQILGAKHPAIGKQGFKIWEEIEESIGPAVRGALEGQSSKFYKDGLLVMERNGFQEECYFIYTYCPIYNENMRVGGVFNTAVETTKSVLSTRRLQLLRQLGNINRSDAISEVYNFLSEAMSAYLSDLPFTLMYLLDDNEKKKLTLTLSTGIKRGTVFSPKELIFTNQDKDIIWPLWTVIDDGTSIRIDDLAKRIGELPGGVWPESCRLAVAHPIISNTTNRPIGLFIAGISPRLNYDDDYKSFIELVVNHIGKAIDTVRVYEAQRQKLEELAKIDQAKTVFFTNISHEFRTPLTLMLGPLADSLNDMNNPLADAQRDRQLMIQRNALRLLKLVNMILDFSRIEAGRAQVTFVPTDVAKLTRELCQLFSPLMEESSLDYIIDITSLAQHVFVDVEMWEKILMNLISNAYKFTLKGHIIITLRQESNYVALSVADSGVGIPEEELPNVFKRFHRIEGSNGRSFEGSGIGLAMIQELIKLHGGTIEVKSKLGEGSTFTVKIPFGSAHLPRDKIHQQLSLHDKFSLSANSKAIVEEVTSWSGIDNMEKSTNHHGLLVPQCNTYRILLADDNLDMRNYIKNILIKHWGVETAVDGEEAYTFARNNPPDLILSDIMMPRLDGFGLIKKIRDNPLTKSIPIILLSARAGEESKIEGLGAGTKHLTKPFILANFPNVKY
jgi:signal transduction histidine kinase